MTFYIDSADRNAAVKVKNTLKLMIREKIEGYSHIVVLCIGTDRVTGDSLGPFVGDKLEKAFVCSVYGTIHNPVHAKNLKAVLGDISGRGKPLIIAIDAALGTHIGSITVADEGIKPGTALNKDLPVSGAIGITGIVNSEAGGGMKILQNTRLSTVIDMSEVIAEGVKGALAEVSEKSFLAV
ncbi:MAG: spore protease YyaC [Clostridiales bacterium]|nr:spore protease YyaC [Clostridiales bacterium]